MPSQSRLRSIWCVLLAVLALWSWAAMLPAEEPAPRSRGLGSQSGDLTSLSEKPIADALGWLSRHQAPDGSWSIEGFSRQCKGEKCSGPGEAHDDMAATALGVLPFLAAGQTHTTKGPYQKTVYRGLYCLMAQQGEDGSLGGDSRQPMYAHGMATIALANAYATAKTKDRILGQRVQRAVNFIESAQNRESGGWRYVPGDEGDTSVLAWQIVALKSAEKAGLKVDPKTYEGARKWLRSVAAGEHGGRFRYLPSLPPKPSMTAAGLLSSELLGMKREDPAVAEGAAYLLENLPSKEARDCYYWYDATQAMHVLHDQRWDKWNRAIRRTLIETQVKEGCAAGSWDPDRPAKEAWGRPGGRLMVTSLSCLCLEVYYRYLPTFRLDSPDQPPAPKKSDAP